MFKTIVRTASKLAHKHPVFGTVALLAAGVGAYVVGEKAFGTVKDAHATMLAKASAAAPPSGPAAPPSGPAGGPPSGSAPAAPLTSA